LPLTSESRYTVNPTLLAAFTFFADFRLNAFIHHQEVAIANMRPHSSTLDEAEEGGYLVGD